MSEKKTSKEGRLKRWEKHPTLYARHNIFHLLGFTLYILFSLSQVHAQMQEPQEEQLESDLPDEVIAEIIDTTRIVLEPRSRFSDPLTPELIHAIALYPKERLWNLPPTATPQKAVKPTTPPPKNYQFHLTAHPSLPDSLFYQVLFAGRTEKTRGFLHLDRQQLGEARTEGRGDYNLDGLRGGLSHQYQELSEISLDLGLNLKALEWNTPNPQKDLTLFRSNLNWQQQISETTWSTLNLDTTVLRIDHDDSNPRTEAEDWRLNFDMALSWPFLNPIRTGGHVEYFSAGDTEEIIARLYARDDFTPFGPFVFSIGLEGVSFRESNHINENQEEASLLESDDIGEDQEDSQLNVADISQKTDAETDEDKTDLELSAADRPQQTDTENQASLLLNPSLTLTTHLDKHWLIQLEGLRTIARHRLSTLYFDTDYISLNPFLRPEKAWNGQITLKYHQGGKFEVNLSGFAKQVEDLVVLSSQTEPLEITGVQPTNIDASIYGGKLLISARIVDLLDLRLQYTHEVHGEQILYRATDRIDLDAVYHLPLGFHAALKAELRGPRYFDTTAENTLDGYLLLSPQLSKTIGNYVNAFVGGAFAIGEYRLLEKYALSQRNFDFGIELKF